MGRATRVNQVLSQTIEKWPDNLAVVERDVRWTYARLGYESRLLQERLRNAELKKGDRVVLWLQNSALYIAAHVALFEMHGVVVPVHSDALVSDVLRTITHVGAAGIITTSAHWTRNRNILDQSGLRFALLPEEIVAVSEGTKTEGTPDGLAQILYTSGTTGKPKGVMLSHENLIANTESILTRLCLTPSDAIVAVLPFVFAYGNSVLLTHLFAGAKIVVEQNLQYAHCVVESMKREATTGFSGVASNYAFLLRESSFHASNLPSLRYFTSAGGPMPQGLLRKVQEAFPNRQFHVMYGQTEAAARITMLPPEDLERKAGSAGCPVPGVSLKIMSETGAPVSPRTPGEIMVAGNNIMGGYWLDPTTTKKTLREGWLHTGDFGYVDEEGYLFITGRSSEMIKSGGIRINPEEIEEVLLAHEDISEAGVTGVADELLGERILAGVVLRTGRRLAEKQLLTYCRKHLAPYKRPQAICFLEVVPRSANGKILRAELRQQLTSLHQQSQKPKTDRVDTNKKLKKICE